MLDVDPAARTETHPPLSPLEEPAISKLDSTAPSAMKSSDKEKTQAQANEQGQELEKDLAMNGHDPSHNDAASAPGVSATNDDAEDEHKISPSAPAAGNSANIAPSTLADQDQEMADASPIPAEVMEQDASMNEASTFISTSSGSGMGQAIDQDDLDGGLLDGALDDYDDLDQDTEDTEVGNGEHDFSDDDDDLDDVDDRLLDSSDRPGPDDEMLSPEGTTQSNAAKSDDQDTDSHEHNTDLQDKGSAAVHSEDSDSDLPDPEGSDNEHEDDEDGGDADEEDVEDEDEEEDDDELPAQPTRKDSSAPLSQKPTLNRPTTTEEELKDSGDDLSDLSEFDDTDDSDEDDDMLESKTLQQDSSTKTSPLPAPSALATTANNSTRPAPGGRKRSMQDMNNKDTAKQDQDSIKTEQEDQIEIPTKRARLSEPANRNKASPEVEEVQNSDKESGSEAADEDEEDEEEEEKVTRGEDEADAEAEGDEGEDEETKQMHKEALDALTSIEVEFANLRDKMYEERMTELDREVEMINDGTHPELSSLMQEIEQKREHRLRVADMGKKYKKDIAQNHFVIQEYQAYCSFQSARRNARSETVRALGKKQQQLILELALSSDTRQRNVIADKSALVRARKLKRSEVNELKAMSERRGFPVSTKPLAVTRSELEEDFTALGLARPAPSPTENTIAQEPHLSRHNTHGPPMMSMHPASAPPRPLSSSRWSSAPEYPPHPSITPPGGYYGARPEVEIYVDGNRCMIDGIWYKPSDSVVVLDAAIGKYNAKYLFLANDEIMLQRTDGSKTRLHLSLFRGRKLCMQPKA
ncbi:hypothetical protein EC968_006356 [Mortierella alpina]|nr:hypothetical protein EC968_006356 [Mortierella alpina]